MDKSQRRNALNGMKGEGGSAKTLKAFRESATRGDAHSQAQLGNIYLHGLGVDRDYKLALGWYRKAAEQGHGEAQANLGHMYEKGLGIEPDIQRALAWYKKSVAQGNALGQILLGDLYLNGTGVDQSSSKAIACYLKSAEQGTDPGNAGLALLRLGAMYLQGRGVEKDLRKGFELYHHAAELGNAEAQRNVGAMYRDGVGVERDHKKAQAWFQRSARENKPPADSAMGDIFRDGLLVEKNIPEAMKWYEKAAARGDKYAKKELLKLLQKEYARESFQSRPAPAVPAPAPAALEAQSGERSEIHRPPAGAKPKTAKKAPEKKSIKPIAEKTKETKKAQASRTRRYWVAAIGMIVLSVIAVSQGFRKRSGPAPARPLPKTIPVAAPWFGPQAIPTMIPELPPGTPKMSLARESPPQPSAKIPPPVAAPPPAAAPPKPAAIRLRGEFRTLDEGEVAAMLAARNMFDARRNPAGDFPHRYEARNVGGLGLVVDRATGLVWSRQQNPVRMNMEKTVRWIASLNQIRFGGSDRWRLPTVEEAAALLQGSPEDGKTFLAAIFGKGIGEIWTGDRFGESESWTVDFRDGTVKSAKSKTRLMTLMVSSGSD